MRIGERIPIILALLILFSMIGAFSLRYLPIMRIECVSTSGLPFTVSLKRLMFPLEGRYLPSIGLPGVRRDAESLPYIEKASFEYSDGNLLLEYTKKGGYVALSEDGSYFVSGEERNEIALEDLPALSEIYPLVYAEDIDGLMEDWEYISSLLSSLDELGDDRRLIDSIEYCNNNREASGLSLVFSDLNARICIMEAVSASGIEESIDVIRKEQSGLNPPYSEYGLYSDRLVKF